MPIFQTDKLSKKQWYILAIFLVAIYVYLCNAWVGDDAYISFRYVDNLVNGHGLRFNLIDRVHGFTNPLWVLLLVPIHFLTQWWGRDSIYFAALLVQFILFLGLIKWSIRFFTLSGAIALVSLMLCSRAFVEYNASGLENSLNFVLIAGVFANLAKSKVNRKWVFVFGGLLIFSRLDQCLLLIPVYLHIFRLSYKENKLKETVKLAFLAHVPLLLWLLFATIYYGSPLPNTLMAKLGFSNGLMQRLAQPIFYYLSSLKQDPVLATVLILSPLIVAKQKNAYIKALGQGALIFLLYVFYIGGDFMSGRLYTSPYWVFILLIVFHFQFRISWRLLSILAISMAVLLPQSTHLKPGIYQKSFKLEHGISDEKMFFYKGLGFLNVMRSNWKVSSQRKRRADKLLLENTDYIYEERVAIGQVGFYIGEKGYVVDKCALTDAFLAHLPPGTANERIGHMIRICPKGYLDVLFKDESFENMELQALYDDVKLVHQASLFAPGRFKAMWRLNTGFHKIKPGYEPAITN